MPGLIARLPTYVVIFSIATAVAFNLVVLSSCEFFVGSTDGSTQDNVELGLFRFSVNDDSSLFDTSGVCEDYSNWPQGEDVPDAVRAAQVFSCLAPIFGLILFLLVVMNQCCCHIPCSGILLDISMTGANVSMALVWLITRNDVCDTLRGGCEWGNAAIYNLVAQILYVLAAIFARYMPSTEVRAAEQRADTAESKADNSEAEVTRLQQELDQQTKRVQELEQENDNLTTALAAATAAKSAAADADRQPSVGKSIVC